MPARGELGVNQAGTTRPRGGTGPRHSSPAFRPNQGRSRHGRDSLGPRRPRKTREVGVERDQRPAAGGRHGRDVRGRRQVPAGSACQRQALELEPAPIRLHDKTRVGLGQRSHDPGTRALGGQWRRRDRRACASSPETEDRSPRQPGGLPVRQARRPALHEPGRGRARNVCSQRG